MTPKQLRERQARMAAQVVVDAFKCRVYDTMCLDPHRCTSENACCAGEVELRDAANGPWEGKCRRCGVAFQVPCGASWSEAEWCRRCLEAWQESLSIAAGGTHRET